MKTILMILLLFLLTGCRTVRETQSTRDDRRQATATIAATVRTDSVNIYRHDSIYVLQRGDTMFIDRWHTLTAYRDRLRTDTLRTIDSVRVEVVKEVERVVQLSAWSSFFATVGRIFVGILFGALLFLIFLIVKKIWK
jgi:hypothetical protein